MIFFDLFSHNPEVVVHGRIVEKLQHGSIVGELGMVLPGKRSASVVAVSDCEFVEVDEKRFQFLVQQAPYSATEAMAVMAKRLRLRKADQMIPPVGAC